MDLIFNYSLPNIKMIKFNASTLPHLMIGFFIYLITKLVVNGQI